jgi:ribosome-binding factor A
MPTRRPERIAAQIAREAGEIVRFTLGDPKIRLVTVNRAEVSPDLRRATIFVTVLGDGRGTAGYEKRTTIRDHLLASVAEVIEVTIPEELASGYPEAKLDEVESTAIDSAHVVLCIEAPDQEPLGLYTELARYFRPSEADKWFRIWPINRPDPLHPSLVAGLASEFVARIDEYPYRWNTGRVASSSEWRAPAESGKLRCVDRTPSSIKSLDSSGC